MYKSNNGVKCASNIVATRDDFVRQYNNPPMRSSTTAWSDQILLGIKLLKRAGERIDEAKSYCTSEIELREENLRADLDLVPTEGLHETNACKCDAPLGQRTPLGIFHFEEY